MIGNERNYSRLIDGTIVDEHSGEVVNNCSAAIAQHFSSGKVSFYWPYGVFGKSPKAMSGFGVAGQGDDSITESMASQTYGQEKMRENVLLASMNPVKTLHFPAGQRLMWRSAGIEPFAICVLGAERLTKASEHAPIGARTNVFYTDTRGGWMDAIARMIPPPGAIHFYSTECTTDPDLAKSALVGLDWDWESGSQQFTFDQVYTQQHGESAHLNDPKSSAFSAVVDPLENNALACLSLAGHFRASYSILRTSTGECLVYAVAPEIGQSCVTNVYSSQEEKLIQINDLCYYSPGLRMGIRIWKDVGGKGGTTNVTYGTHICLRSPLAASQDNTNISIGCQVGMHGRHSFTVVGRPRVCHLHIVQNDTLRSRIESVSLNGRPLTYISRTRVSKITAHFDYCFDATNVWPHLWTLGQSFIDVTIGIWPPLSVQQLQHRPFMHFFYTSRVDERCEPCQVVCAVSLLQIRSVSAPYHICYHLRQESVDGFRSQILTDQSSPLVALNFDGSLAVADNVSRLGRVFLQANWNNLPFQKPSLAVSIDRKWAKSSSKSNVLAVCGIIGRGNIANKVRVCASTSLDETDDNTPPVFSALSDVVGVVVSRAGRALRINLNTAIFNNIRCNLHPAGKNLRRQRLVSGLGIGAILIAIIILFMCFAKRRIIN
jgi:hypothetical protein